MNLLSGLPAPSAVSSADQPAWPDFDIFGLNALASSPSWVSASAENATTSVIPSLDGERDIVIDDMPPSFGYGEQACPTQGLARPMNPAGLAKCQPSLSLCFKQEPSVSVTDLPGQPVPDGEVIVDTALDFEYPDSPVLSEIPLSAFSRTELRPEVPPSSICAVHSSLLSLSVPAPTALTLSPEMPINNSSADAKPHIVQPCLPPAATIYPTSLGDTCSSHGSSSSRTRPHSPQSLGDLRKNCEPTRVTPPKPLGGRVQKQTRRYSAPKSSRYCHLCARHQRCVQMVPCGNVELGLCQKSVCRKCIDLYDLDVSGRSWSCPHCQNKCPQRAKCFAYDRQTARRREKTLKAKLGLLSAGGDQTPPSPAVFKR